jgi:hypothetical protein
LIDDVFNNLATNNRTPVDNVDDLDTVGGFNKSVFSTPAFFRRNRS